MLGRPDCDTLERLVALVVMQPLLLLHSSRFVRCLHRLDLNHGSSLVWTHSLCTIVARVQRVARDGITRLWSVISNEVDRLARLAITSTPGTSPERALSVLRKQLCRAPFVAHGKHRGRMAVPISRMYWSSLMRSSLS